MQSIIEYILRIIDMHSGMHSYNYFVILWGIHFIVPSHSNWLKHVRLTGNFLGGCSAIEIRIRNCSAVFLIFFRYLIVVPIRNVQEIWLTKMDFGRPNAENGRKMANGPLLFLALGLNVICVTFVFPNAHTRCYTKAVPYVFLY